MCFSGNAGAAQQCTRDVLFTVKKSNHLASVTFSVGNDVNKTAWNAFQIYVPRNVSIDGFELRRSDDVILTSYESILACTGQLHFALPSKLPVASASDWNEAYTSILNITLDDVPVDDLLGCEWTLSEKAKSLIATLKDLDATNSAKYFSRNASEDVLKKLREDEALIQPIRKCLYLIGKYHTNEALVDSLLSLLFHELGFFSGMLYPIPQHSLPLQYGGNDSATAKSDQNIVDVLSFNRMIVSEDKNLASIKHNSFPQLVAQAISAVQRNMETTTSQKRKWEDLDESSTILGMRVNGTFFYFYNVNVSTPILTAMKLKTSPAEGTTMKMVGGSEGLNFLIPTQREQIITILDAWRADIEKKGRESVRRLS